DIERELTLLLNLGNAEKGGGDLDAAVATYQRGLDLVEARFGRDDIRVVEFLIDLGAIYVDRLHRPLDGAAMFERAERALASRPDDPKWVTLYQNHGVALFKGDRLADAIAPLEHCQERAHRGGHAHIEAKCDLMLSYALWLARKDGAGAAA